MPGQDDPFQAGPPTRRDRQSAFADAVWSDMDRVRARLLRDALDDDTLPGDRARIFKALADVALKTEDQVEIAAQLAELEAKLGQEGGDAW